MLVLLWQENLPIRALFHEHNIAGQKRYKLFCLVFRLCILWFCGSSQFNSTCRVTITYTLQILLSENIYTCIHSCVHLYTDTAINLQGTPCSLYRNRGHISIQKQKAAAPYNQELGFHGPQLAFADGANHPPKCT